MFRKSVLTPLHRDKLIEFDRSNEKARISPLGNIEVETKLLSDKCPR